MKRLLSYLIFLGVILGVSLGSAHSVHADGAGFEVSAVPAPQQVDKTVTYYDLKLQPKTTTNISVNIKNTSQKPITVTPTIAKATTNLNGVVEYRYLKADQSRKLPADITKLLTTQSKSVALKVGETKPVTFTIKMPTKPYDGILAGGLNFTLKPAKTTAKNKGVAIINQYSYAIAVVLHGRRDLTVNHLNLGKIKPIQINGRNTLNLPLENQTAAYLNRVNTTVNIYRRHGQKAIYQQALKQGQIAPNSIYQLPLRIGETKFKPGHYTAKVKVVSKQQHWQFTQNFTITAKTANKYNQKAVIKRPQRNWNLIFSIIGVLVILIVFLIIYWRKQRQIKTLKAQLTEQENDKLIKK